MGNANKVVVLVLAAKQKLTYIHLIYRESQKKVYTKNKILSIPTIT